MRLQLPRRPQPLARSRPCGAPRWSRHNRLGWRASTPLDLPCFLRFFAADATLFSPSPIDDRTQRVEPADLPVYWSKMFARLGEGRRSLANQPRKVVITRLGPTAAVASYHLTDDANNPGRRTLVWRRERAGWRIVRLHGSRVAPQPP